jgi:hypothetical protein
MEITVTPCAVHGAGRLRSGHKILHITGLFTLRPFGARAPKNRSRAKAHCAVFLRHILARRNAAHCFIGGPKRRKQPERYVP